MATQRPVSSVPQWIRWLLPVVLVVQVAFRLTDPGSTAVAAQLEAPPAMSALRLAALGEPIGLAQMLTLRLQAFDTQPGISVPFRDLDYDNMVLWLDRVLQLDAASGYPLLLASQVYSQVPDSAKQRAMLDFVHRQFLEDPERRWRWLAHAALVARHRLNDRQLALTYARAIAEEADEPSVPSWARQMHIFLLADLGEHEAAKILLGGLLASGTVTDAHEQRFLLERLKALESVENSSLPTKP
jgi:hypothetical protein